MSDSRPPFVSVVMPAYNAAATIAEALRSVLAQTFRDFEILVVDDASTDGTFDIAQRTVSHYPAARILRLEVNSGPAAARNRGIREAKGEWIAFLDADDAWLPWALEDECRALSFFPDAALLCGDYVGFSDSDVARVDVGKEHCMDIVLRDFIDRTPVDTLTVLARKSVLSRLGGFDEQFRGPEDYELWMRVAAAGRIVKIRAPMARYRAHAGSLSMNSRPFLRESLRVVEKAFGPQGVLHPYRRYRRRRQATLYVEAAWGVWHNGARGCALRWLLCSWLLWPGRIKVEESKPLWRLGLLATILVRSPRRDDTGGSGH
ncbi:MAG: glycosyltransferase [Kiritimatiellae bacterium]|nr:glycosyltransferase [Kiritimatiellia bacterium]